MSPHWGVERSSEVTLSLVRGEEATSRRQGFYSTGSLLHPSCVPGTVLGSGGDGGRKECPAVFALRALMGRRMGRPAGAPRAGAWHKPGCGGVGWMAVQAGNPEGAVSCPEPWEDL